jgi:hypothetical protein
MKKAILIIIALSGAFTTQHVFSQVQKGDSNIGVNTLISSFVGTDAPNSNGLISLTYQYYVTNNISIGVGPYYSFSTSESSSPGFSTESWSNTFGLNTFINYSFLTTGGKVLPYIGAQFSYQNTYSGSDTYIAGNYQGEYQDITNTSAGANAGLKFFLTERINFDGKLSYTTILSTTFESGAGSFDIDPKGGLLQFTLGLGIILGKKG